MLCITEQEWDKASNEGSDFAMTADPKQPLKAMTSCPYQRNTLLCAAWATGFWSTMGGRYHRMLGYAEDPTPESAMEKMPPAQVRLDIDASLPSGAIQILRERERQLFNEGYSAHHDDLYGKDELTRAAGCYLQATSSKHPCQSPWPFHWRYWKPSDDRRRNLVKAGALIAAEIDRRDREEAAGLEPGTGHLKARGA